MRIFSRRSLLSSLGVALPLGLGQRAGASQEPPETAPMLRLRPFEEAVREAFAGRDRTSPEGGGGHAGIPPCRRVEIGHSDQVWAGLQGCHNDRSFAGFPAGHLRIVRIGSGPGPVRNGVRLHVTSVEVAVTGGLVSDAPGRPLDFATLPPAPGFA